MHEKIQRYKEYMIRETVNLNLTFLEAIKKMNVPEKEKESTRVLIENSIKSQLLIYIDVYPEFSVMEFVTNSKTLFDIHKSLGHTKCATTKQIHTTHANQIYP